MQKFNKIDSFSQKSVTKLKCFILYIENEFSVRRCVNG
nr:MAG TPA: hypothetical protein [Caudoviricetes sp.]